jgi:hypothetical protein
MLAPGPVGGYLLFLCISCIESEKSGPEKKCSDDTDCDVPVVGGAIFSS